MAPIPVPRLWGPNYRLDCGTSMFICVCIVFYLHFDMHLNLHFYLHLHLYPWVGELWGRRLGLRPLPAFAKPFNSSALLALEFVFVFVLVYVLFVFV